MSCLEMKAGVPIHCKWQIQFLKRSPQLFHEINNLNRYEKTGGQVNKLSFLLTNTQDVIKSGKET